MTAADPDVPPTPVLTPAERELATRPFGFAAVRLILLALALLWIIGIGWEIYQGSKADDLPLVQRIVTASLFTIACLFGAAVMTVRQEIVRLALLMIVSGGIVHVCVQGAYLAWKAGQESGALAVTGIVLGRLLVILLLANLVLWFLRNDVRAWYETLPEWFPKAADRPKDLR